MVADHLYDGLGCCISPIQAGTQEMATCAGEQPFWLGDGDDVADDVVAADLGVGVARPVWPLRYLPVSRPSARGPQANAGRSNASAMGNSSRSGERSSRLSGSRDSVSLRSPKIDPL